MPNTKKSKAKRQMRSKHTKKNRADRKPTRRQSRKQRAGSVLGALSQILSPSSSPSSSNINNNAGTALCAPAIIKPGSSNSKGGGSRNENAKVRTKKSVHPESCLTHPVLLKLAKAWNTHVRKHTAAIRAIRAPARLPPAELWEALRERIGKAGEPEDHWLKHEIVKSALSNKEIEEIKDDHYRPEAPKEWHERADAWLSTTDIEDLLEQYEDKYPEFKSYGASPIDFDLKGRDVGREPGQSGAERCMVNPLCNINLKELTKNRKVPIKYIGVVFNLDPHDKAGSHWISMYVNLPKQEINFWDSYGYQPPKEVTTLMDKLQKQGRAIGMTAMKKQINTTRHQYKNSECGMYSSWFIIQQLEGKSFKEVCQNIIRDDEMNAKRRQFYNY